MWRTTNRRDSTPAARDRTRHCSCRDSRTPAPCPQRRPKQRALAGATSEIRRPPTPAVPPGAADPRRRRGPGPGSRAPRQTTGSLLRRSPPALTAARHSDRSRPAVLPSAALSAGDRQTLSGRLLAFGQDMAGDDDFLDLAGAVVDLGDLGVAEVAFDVVALQVAAATEDLDGVRRVLHAVVAAEDLGHGGFPREAHALPAHGGGAPGEPPPGLDLGRHLSQHELDRLQVGERFAELGAPQGMGTRRVESGPGEPERDRGDVDAGDVETGHGDLESLPLLAEQVLTRDTHTVERHP